MHTKQKITMPHNSTSKTWQNQPIIVTGFFQLNHKNDTKTLKVTGIAQDVKII